MQAQKKQKKTPKQRRIGKQKMKNPIITYYMALLQNAKQSTHKQTSLCLKDDLQTCRHFR